MEEVLPYVHPVIKMLEPYIRAEAGKHFGQEVEVLELGEIKSKEKFGATGSLLIVSIEFVTEFGPYLSSLAIKFVPSKASAMLELKNATLLENQFFAFPQFGIPKILLATTDNPVVLIYEGIEGINYDEIPRKQDLPKWAGKMLALIHGSEIRPVDDSLYRDLARILGKSLEHTGMEVQISNAMGRAYQNIQQSYSGCNAFSDFHQSNVMVTYANSTPIKMWVIDPEFMQVGSFDRMEDVGTFFGFQFLMEYIETGEFVRATLDLLKFLDGYNEILFQLTGRKLYEIYPNGIPVPFFIAMWALMDAIDLAVNRIGNNSYSHPEVVNRLNFAVALLNNQKFHEQLKSFTYSLAKKK